MDETEFTNNAEQEKKNGAMKSIDRRRKGGRGETNDEFRACSHRDAQKQQEKGFRSSNLISRPNRTDECRNLISVAFAKVYHGQILSVGKQRNNYPEGRQSSGTGPSINKEKREMKWSECKQQRGIRSYQPN